MARSEALITTERSSRLLQQLCRQFADKVPVVHTQGRGQITFLLGSCKLAAREGALTMVVEAEDEASVAEIEASIAPHLERMAFQEQLAIALAGLEGLKF